MSKKTDKLFAKFDERLQGLKAAQARIGELETTLAAQEAEADAAASAGDLAGYKSARAVADDTAAQLHVARRVYEKNAGTDLQAEAAEVWADFAEEKTAEIRKAYAAVEAQLRELRAKVLSAVAVQQEAEHMHARLSEASGTKLSLRGMFLPKAIVPLANYLNGASLLSKDEKDRAWRASENSALVRGLN